MRGHTKQPGALSPVALPRGSGRGFTRKLMIALRWATVVTGDPPGVTWRRPVPLLLVIALWGWLA